MRDRERLREPFGERCAHPCDERVHRRIGWQQIGKHRQQAIAIVAQSSLRDVQIQHREELAVRSGVGDQRLAGAIVDQNRRRHGVVRVPAENRIDAGHPCRQFQIDIHAVVRQQHDDLRAGGARLVDLALQFALADAEFPLLDEAARMGDRRVGERLPDDRGRHAVDFAQRARLEHAVFEITCPNVLREKFDSAGQFLVDCLAYPLRAISELPVRGHDVDTEQLAGFDHVGAAGPQCGRRALPTVAAV